MVFRTILIQDLQCLGRRDRVRSLITHPSALTERMAGTDRSTSDRWIDTWRPMTTASDD